MTTTTRKPAPRTCCWMCSDPRGFLALRHRTPFAITDRDITTGYWLERVPGGWRIFKDTPDGSEPTTVYTILAFTRNAPTTWSCDCKAGQYGRVVCRHVAGVAALLKRIGCL